MNPCSESISGWLAKAKAAGECQDQFRLFFLGSEENFRVVIPRLSQRQECSQTTFNLARWKVSLASDSGEASSLELSAYHISSPLDFLLLDTLINMRSIFILDVNFEDFFHKTHIPEEKELEVSFSKPADVGPTRTDSGAIGRKSKGSVIGRLWKTKKKEEKDKKPGEKTASTSVDSSSISVSEDESSESPRKNWNVHIPSPVVPKKRGNKTLIGFSRQESLASLDKSKPTQGESSTESPESLPSPSNEKPLSPKTSPSTTTAPAAPKTPREAAAPAAPKTPREKLKHRSKSSTSLVRGRPLKSASPRDKSTSPREEGDTAAVGVRRKGEGGEQKGKRLSTDAGSAAVNSKSASLGDDSCEALAQNPSACTHSSGSVVYSQDDSKLLVDEAVSVSPKCAAVLSVASQAQEQQLSFSPTAPAVQERLAQLEQVLALKWTCPIVLLGMCPLHLRGGAALRGITDHLQALIRRYSSGRRTISFFVVDAPDGAGRGYDEVRAAIVKKAQFLNACDAGVDPNAQVLLGSPLVLDFAVQCLVAVAQWKDAFPVLSVSELHSFFAQVLSILKELAPTNADADAVADVISREQGLANLFVNASALSQALHNLGYAINLPSRHDDDEDWIVVNQLWVSLTLHSLWRALLKRNNNGVLAGLNSISIDTEFAERVWSLLARLELGCSVQAPSASHLPGLDQKSYIIPHLLNRNPPTISSLSWWKPALLGELCICRTFTFQVLPPPSFQSRLVCRLLDVITASHTWYSGLMGVPKNCPEGAQVCIRLEGKRVEVLVCGKESINFLRVVCEIIEALRTGWFNFGVVQNVPLLCQPCLSKHLFLRIKNLTKDMESELEDTLDTLEAVAMKQGQGALVSCLLCACGVAVSGLAPDISLVDLSLFKIDFSEIQLQEELGRGAFGVVRRGMFRGESVAVKMLDHQVMDENPDIYSAFRQEVWVSSRLDHPNIVSMWGCCLDPLCIVMEFVPCGCLTDLLAAGTLDTTMKLRIAFDIAHALAFLHNQDPKIIHRDLRSQNVMVMDSSGKSEVICKVTDFGESRYMASQFASRDKLDNPRWLAPEIMMGLSYNEKSDIFSFGVVLWEVGFGHGNQPYHDITSGDFASKLEDEIIAGLRPQFDVTEMPMEYGQVMCSCWGHHPRSRPGSIDVLQDIMHIMQQHCPDVLPLYTHRMRLLAAPALMPTSVSQTAFDFRVDKSEPSSLRATPKPSATFSPRPSMVKSGNLPVEAISAPSTVMSSKKMKPPHPGHVQFLLQVDNLHVWAGCSTGIIRVWQNTRAVVAELDNESPVLCMIQVRDNVWVGSDDGAIRMYNSGSRKLECVLKNSSLGGPVSVLALVGQTLVWSGTRVGELHIWAAERALTRTFIEELYMRMKHPVRGIKLRTLRLRLKTLKNVVSGPELLDWITANSAGIVSTTAVLILKEMENRKMIEPTSEDGHFSIPRRSVEAISSLTDAAKSASLEVISKSSTEDSLPWVDAESSESGAISTGNIQYFEATLRESGKAIQVIAEDGDFCWVGSGCGIDIYNCKTRVFDRSLKQVHQASVSAIAPVGRKQVWTADSGGVVVIWTKKGLVPVKEVTSNPDVKILTLFPFDDAVITCASNRTLTLWSLKTQAPTKNMGSFRYDEVCYHCIVRSTAEGWEFWCACGDKTILAVQAS